jgi:serine protease Do
LRPEDCGGPIVNLDGEVVGFNVARSGRTETYAIASASLAKLIAELMPDGNR